MTIDMSRKTALVIVIVITVLVLPIVHANTFVKIAHVLSAGLRIPSGAKVQYIGVIEHYGRPYVYIVVSSSSSVQINIILPNGTVLSSNISSKLYTGTALHYLDLAVGTFNNLTALVMYLGDRLYLITQRSQVYRYEIHNCYSLVLADVDNDGVPEILLGCQRDVNILKFSNGKLVSLHTSLHGALETYVFLMGVVPMHGLHVYGYICGGFPVKCKPLWISISYDSSTRTVILNVTEGEVLYSINKPYLAEPHALLYASTVGSATYLVSLNTLRKVSGRLTEAMMSILQVVHNTFKKVKTLNVSYVSVLRYCDWSVVAQHGSLYNGTYLVLLNDTELSLIQASTGEVIKKLRLPFEIGGVAANGLVCAGSTCAVVLLDTRNETHVLFLNGTDVSLGVVSGLVYTFGPYIAVLRDGKFDLYKLVVYVPVTHAAASPAVHRVSAPIALRPAVAPVPVTRLVFRHLLSILTIRKTIGELVYVSYAASVTYGFPIRIDLKFNGGMLTIPKGTVPLVGSSPTYVRTVNITRVHMNVTSSNIVLLTPIYNVSTVPEVTSFSRPLILKIFTYKIVRGMYVLYFNRTLHRWIPLPTLIAYNGTVVAYIRHTGLYAVGVWRPRQIKPTISVTYVPVVSACSPTRLLIRVTHDGEPVKNLIVRVYVNGAYRYYCISSKDGSCIIVFKTCRVGVYTIVVKAGLSSRIITLWVYPKIQNIPTQSSAFKWATW